MFRSEESSRQRAGRSGLWNIPDHRNGMRSRMSKSQAESVAAALADLIKDGDALRPGTRDFDSIGDEKRELHVQARSRWLANSKTVLRHAGLDNYSAALDTLTAGTARGPFQIAEILGLLESAKVAVERGITTEGRSRDFGEILSDMLSLAKGALATNTEGSKNVAAALVSFPVKLTG